jgi:glycosyltransferase involved in cell wall biosynthesis
MSVPVPRVWIVVPCFNEARRLPVEAFLTFSREQPDLGFCFVNDGSADDTAQVLRRLVDRGAPRMLALDLPVNGGKAEAVRAGVRHVLAERDPAWVGYWDADLATPLEEIPPFLTLAECHPGARFLLGSRVRRLGARVERGQLRHYLGRVFATCASVVLRLPVYDTQCGAKLIGADLARRIFEQPFLSRWIFDIELLARTIALIGRHAAMEAVIEVPLERWEEKGDSRVRPIHFLRAPLELWRIHCRYRVRGRRS